MKTAVFYYSYDGNCALAAEFIKDALKAEAFEIKTVDNRKRKGFVKMIWGVFQIMTNKKPALEPLAADPNSYDLVVLGTPVWADSPAPAMVSFLNQTPISGKKIALFCSYGGGPGQVFTRLKERLFGNAFVGEIGFKEAAKMDKDELKRKIGEWVTTLT